jgi:hypothetical protein
VQNFIFVQNFVEIFLQNFVQIFVEFFVQIFVEFFVQIFVEFFLQILPFSNSDPEIFKGASIFSSECKFFVRADE